jgi:uncharacterized protein YukE
MGTSLSAAPADMKGVVDELSGKVDALVNDAGWQGDAATNFRKKWTTDAITSGGLSDVVGQVGAILSDLSTKLQQVENALHDAATEAAKQGVPIGPNGNVMPMITANPPSPQVATKLQAAQAYGQEYIAALQMAEGFRLNAASSLSDLYDQIGPDGSLGTPDQWTTIGDYLRGLYAIPNEKNSRILKNGDTKLQAAKDEMNQARKDLKAAKSTYQAKGLKLPSSSDAKLAHSKALSELDDLKTNLSAAKAGDGELPLSKFLNTKLGDIASEIPVLSKFSKLEGLVDAIKDIPIIDIAASGAVAALQYKDDVNKGWSPGHAAGADFGAAAIGLGVGAGVGAVAALASAPAWLTAAGVGIVAAGVGDVAYQAFQENWSEDDAQHGGFWGGTVAGTGHVFENVGKDMAHMGEDVWNGVKSLWNDVF